MLKFSSATSLSIFPRILEIPDPEILSYKKSIIASFYYPSCILLCLDLNLMQFKGYYEGVFALASHTQTRGFAINWVSSEKTLDPFNFLRTRIKILKGLQFIPCVCISVLYTCKHSMMHHEPFFATTKIPSFDGTLNWVTRLSGTGSRGKKP